MKVAW